MTFFTVAWIVAAALLGSTLSISASPDSSPIVSGTSNAIQKTREAPMVNTSDVFHSAGLSEVELLQRISKFNRRSKRDSDTEAALLAAKIGLNILGITVSIVAPIPGSFILIFATLLDLCFPENKDPVKQIKDIVWNERIKEQRLKLISIRNTMNEIKRQYEITKNISIPHGRMLTLYDILTSQQCLFMYDDNIEASADYFSEFALIHIAVNQALILAHPDEIIFQESLVRIVKEYVAYAKHAQKIESQNNMHRYKRVTDVRSLFDPHIQKWTKQLPAHLQAEVNEQGWIRNGEVVSFEMSYLPGRWLSCYGAGRSECKWRNCPGQDNPMERGSQYQHYWKCAGEVFWIYPIDDSDRFIKSCSQVGILYGQMSGQDWWLSMQCRDWSWFVCRTYTAACTGSDTTKMRQGHCSSEVWTITAIDKHCGEPILDRDVVLLGHTTNTSRICLFNSDDRAFRANEIRADFGVFTIFRSNIDHGEYKKDLVCLD